MHKCINKSEGNIYHLEQMVDNFFPYSRQQLKFDQPVTIIFQSDVDNSSKMLGKTAFYDPEQYEVTLYVDGRHPKDVMRSLSHELVHHAQNCRGDFRTENGTGVGYAQRDPHLRDMEREAYTKGNLIFRDFEDLIKTGKITIDIDFKKSGEPKMSLKEWKNNELNTLLMKKWGLLKESKEEITEDTEGEETYDYGEDEGRDDRELGALLRRHATHAHIDALKRDMAYDEEHERRGEGGTHFRESQDDELDELMVSDGPRRGEDDDRKKVQEMGNAGTGAPLSGDRRKEDEDLDEGWGWRKEDELDEIAYGSPRKEDEEDLDEGSMGADVRAQAKQAMGRKEDEESLSEQEIRRLQELIGLGGWGDRKEDEELDEAYPNDGGQRKEDDDLSELSIIPHGDMRDEDDGWGKDPADFTGTRKREKKATAALKKGKGLEEGDPLMQKHKGGHAHRSTDTSSRERLAYEKDPAAWMTTDQAVKLGLSPEEARAAIDMGPGEREHDRGPGDGPGLGKARRKWRKAFAGQFKEGKISVREAKEITRRIVERIKKEGR